MFSLFFFILITLFFCLIF
ncbi:hypothetical protein CAEBREN_29414 [Caenorhabditis brenneri]|uniref:Uncharacterized protein n=1 Tax=Caenorhabditis brenneri TaxID=135651 RepID=G0P8E0_CAEBE|nr:hypothetical protein CAEBREN_29414 [Caenorhabditis brenneri]